MDKIYEFSKKGALIALVAGIVMVINFGLPTTFLGCLHYILHTVAPILLLLFFCMLKKGSEKNSVMSSISLWGIIGSIALFIHRVLYSICQIGFIISTSVNVDNYTLFSHYAWYSFDYFANDEWYFDRYFTLAIAVVAVAALTVALFRFSRILTKRPILSILSCVLLIAILMSTHSWPSNYVLREFFQCLTPIALSAFLYGIYKLKK